MELGVSVSTIRKASCAASDPKRLLKGERVPANKNMNGKNKQIP